MSKNLSILNLQSWKAILVAIISVLLVVSFLSWQYKRIENNSQEKLTSLEDVLIMGLVEEVVDDFMVARISNNENQAILFLTEKAFQQMEEGAFFLTGEITSYRIVKKEKIEEEMFRFRVETYEKDGVKGFPEIIILKKIGGEYYIDSLQIAG
ncbi:MAG: hypothetical protein ABID67_00465 [Candidatus Nealsonbacteria bacterium]